MSKRRAGGHGVGRARPGLAGTQAGYNQSFSGVGASPQAGKARTMHTKNRHKGRI